MADAAYPLADRLLLDDEIDSAPDGPFALRVETSRGKVGNGARIDGRDLAHVGIELEGVSDLRVARGACGSALGMDRMIGENFEKGLARMKAVAEATARRE